MSHTVRPHAIRHDLETFYGQYLEKSVVREGSFEHSYKGFKLLMLTNKDKYFFYVNSQIQGGSLYSKFSTGCKLYNFFYEGSSGDETKVSFKISKVPNRPDLWLFEELLAYD